MKIVLLCCLIAIIACQNKKEPKLDPNDPCSKYMTLSGTYGTTIHDGSMVWKGGLNGTIEFIGVDFNEMTCSYTISDCESGAIQMLCNGADFPTKVLVESPTEIRLNALIYTRLE